MSAAICGDGKQTRVSLRSPGLRLLTSSARCSHDHEKFVMEIGEIKAILLKEWDPLDISDNPYLTDEYDSYLPGLVKLIKADRPSQEIADHLKEIEDDLGITLPSARRMRTAELLAGK